MSYNQEALGSNPPGKQFFIWIKNVFITQQKYPANGRVNFEEWLIYKTQLHGLE